MIPSVRDAQDTVVESARNLWFAGLGMMVVAQEEGNKMFETLVRRGRELEQRGRSPMTELAGRIADVRHKTKETVDAVAKTLDDQVTMTLHRLGVPTRDEIALLARRVETLTVSVEKLKPKMRPMTHGKAELTTAGTVVTGAAGTGAATKG